MTREEAFQNLNLAPEADREAVENAYQRLVRRYPPEFHPERFRTIDDSYRQLTSLAAMIERQMAPSLESPKLEPELFRFELAVPESHIEEALAEIQRESLTAALWP